MLLKRIEGKTLTETLERVRVECGKDALVVETRATRSGYMIVASQREATPPRRDQAGRDQVGRGPLLSQWTRGFRPLADKAVDFGISSVILGAVERALLGTRVDLTRPGDPALPGLATRVLAGLVRTADTVEDRDVEAFRQIALVGPTGVGKTTTLAKLAARARSRGERTAIITLDTFRVAAVEQLRAFADLLAVPFTVAFTASDLRRAVAEHADCDRIFIDTTGRSPNDREAMPMLEGNLRAGGCATLLCLAAGTRRRDSDLVLDAYDRLGPDAVCLTKWDETTMPGEALAAIVERGLPISHLCIGQEVPADIVVADTTALAAAAFDTESMEVSA
ncbi:MAG: type IV secretion system DNA-binding domain-containing protein [Planctomycetes bacterium]|nr:type IV secretion system DNA-binding domain-containing protein [Planctomycetota bacterium]